MTTCEVIDGRAGRAETLLMLVLWTAAVVVVAVFFAGMGVYGLVAPASLVAPFGIGLGSGDARTEVRAVYGGFGLAVAGVLGVASLDPTAHRGALTAVGVAVLGMAGGRLVGRARERPAALYPVWLYFWVEVVIGGVLLAASRALAPL